MPTPPTTHCQRGHERTPDNRAANGQCRECIRINAKLRQQRNPGYRRAWRRRHKDRLRLEHISYRYGMTVDEYKKLLAEQENRCAICGVEFGDSTTPHVDHRHSDGKVRGLLCRSCNSGLGQFKDDPEAMRRAAAYLEVA